MPQIDVLLLFTFALVFLPTVHAFGAGDIPDFAYLNDKAFRHGDIENVLETLAKAAGHATGKDVAAAIAHGVSNILQGVGPHRDKAKGNFNKMDIKRVYFGNWLRDYSQAMDIAGLSKLTADSLVTIITVLGFMTFGFATREFEVTAERLGVYLPVEHIDNPKGYAENAQKIYRKLRPPVQSEELDIDERTGMKNYIGNEDGGWDTSTAHVRRVFTACIQHGRKAHGVEGNELWEAFRLLGTGLHTIEDLLAHSNWCELALRKMGYKNVFCHVGEEVTVDTPLGPAPPLVTGTFGSADFIHSLLGEATDHISQASVSDLSQKLDDAKTNSSQISTIKTLLAKLPLGSSSSNQEVQKIEDIRKNAIDIKASVNGVISKEAQKQLKELMIWHDDVMREVAVQIQSVPGLQEIYEQIQNALTACVYLILEPYLKPLLQQLTVALQEGSAEAINSEDQYEVFNDTTASDPTHSILSKDHFALILNEPAGKIAQDVVKFVVPRIVEAWYDRNIDVNQCIDEILESFHHPFFARDDSKVQCLMFESMQRWFQGLQKNEQNTLLGLLTKESVRDGLNKRPGSQESVKPHGGKPSATGGKRPTGGKKPGKQAAATSHGKTKPPKKGSKKPHSRRDEEDADFVEEDEEVNEDDQDFVMDEDEMEEDEEMEAEAEEELEEDAEEQELRKSNRKAGKKGHKKHEDEDEDEDEEMVEEIEEVEKVKKKRGGGGRGKRGKNRKQKDEEDEDEEEEEEGGEDKDEDEDEYDEGEEEEEEEKKPKRKGKEKKSKRSPKKKQKDDDDDYSEEEESEEEKPKKHRKH